MSGVQKLPPILNQETMKRKSPWQNGSQEKKETSTPKPDHKENALIYMFAFFALQNRLFAFDKETSEIHKHYRNLGGVGKRTIVRSRKHWAQVVFN
jgi:hypothetical protein